MMVNEKNNVFKHFVIIGAGTIVNMIIGLLTTPLITRIVDPVEYGKLSIFTMYSNIAVMVLCLGLDQALVRYYFDEKTDNYKRKLLQKCVVLPVIISIIFSILFVFLVATDILVFEFSTFIAILLCIYTIIQIIYRFSLLLVRLEYNSKLFSCLNVVSKISYVSLAMTILLFTNTNSLLALITATILSSFICMVASIIVQANLWNFFKRNKEENLPIDKKLKQLIKYSYPFIISMGITTLFQAIDKISLNIYCTYHEIGIYSSTMSLVHIFALVQSTFNTVWAPMSVEHYTSHPNDKDFYKKVNKIITLIMFFLGVSLILVKDVFSILLGAKYREAAYILPFLIFNPIMYTISETTVCGLVFMKKSKSQVVVAIGSCVANIIGNIILVPIFGPKGAAISTGISYIIFFSLRTFLSNKVFYIDFDLKKFYFITFIVSLYALYNTFVKFNIFSIIGYVLVVLTMVILYNESVRFIWSYVKKSIINRREKNDEKDSF